MMEITQTFPPVYKVECKNCRKPMRTEISEQGALVVNQCETCGAGSAITGCNPRPDIVSVTQNIEVVFTGKLRAEMNLLEIEAIENAFMPARWELEPVLYHLALKQHPMHEIATGEKLGTFAIRGIPITQTDSTSQLACTPKHGMGRENIVNYQITVEW